MNDYTLIGGFEKEEDLHEIPEILHALTELHMWKKRKWAFFLSLQSYAFFLRARMRCLFEDYILILPCEATL